MHSVESHGLISQSLGDSHQSSHGMTINRIPSFDNVIFGNIMGYIWDLMVYMVYRYHGFWGYIYIYIYIYISIIIWWFMGFNQPTWGFIEIYREYSGNLFFHDLYNGDTWGYGHIMGGYHGDLRGYSKTMVEGVFFLMMTCGYIGNRKL